MEEAKETMFKALCRTYFQGISVEDLRRYGRHLELQKPTTMKKDALIDEMLSVLCDEKKPARNLRGAPIKNIGFLPEIPLQIEKFREEVFGVNYNTEKPSVEKKLNQERYLNDVVVLNFSLPINDLTEEQKRLAFELLESLTK